ncbi:MAG TPA: Crp/Fnr family transcriptional regulator [Sinorhizobium sp.]|nr:Crp/Fnr family transcriptional regulator [Sinorhizobium sp.]
MPTVPSALPLTSDHHQPAFHTLADFRRDPQGGPDTEFALAPIGNLTSGPTRCIMQRSEKGGASQMTFASHAFPRVLETSIFRIGLDGSDKAYLGSLGFILRRYPPHAVIARQGDEEERIFIIHSGWGCICTDLMDGERQILDFPLKGEFVASRAFEGEASESFIAQTELMVFEAPAKAFASGLTHSPSLSAILLGAIARERAILVQHLTNLGRRSALIRTAHLLLELGTRLEKADAANGNGFECPLTQYDLADALGLTAIHVNRMLRELRERGYLEFRHGCVHFLNREGLERFADFDPEYLRLPGERRNGYAS